MNAENRQRTTGSTHRLGRRSRPRVVIFDLAGQPRVEVIDVPEDADVGDSICHGGSRWRVIGVRTGDRVLIAEPEAN